MGNGIESVLKADCMTGLPPLYRWWVLVWSGTKRLRFLSHFVSLMGTMRVMGAFVVTVYHFFPEGSCLVISSSLCKVVLHDEGRGGQNAVLRCSTFTITDGPQALGRRSAFLNESSKAGKTRLMTQENLSSRRFGRWEPDFIPFQKKMSATEVKPRV